MARTMNIAEAKGKLSALVNAALAGETVELAQAGKPVVRLVPILPGATRKPGILKQLGWTQDVPMCVFDPEESDAKDGPLVQP